MCFGSTDESDCTFFGRSKGRFTVEIPRGKQVQRQGSLRVWELLGAFSVLGRLSQAVAEVVWVVGALHNHRGCPSL